VRCGSSANWTRRNATEGLVKETKNEHED